MFCNNCPYVQESVSALLGQEDELHSDDDEEASWIEDPVRHTAVLVPSWCGCDIRVHPTQGKYSLVLWLFKSTCKTTSRLDNSGLDFV